MFGISRGFLVTVILCEILHAAYGGVKDDSKLVRRLMKYYTRELAPDGPKGSGLPVKHSLFLNRIVNFEDQVLTLDGFVSTSWRDERLKWGSEFSAKALRLDSQSLWQPDILLLNSAEPRTDMGSGNIKAVVTREGEVGVYIPQTIKSYCKDTGKDVITCDLQFMSWTYDSGLLDLHPKADTADLTYFDQAYNKEWKLESTTSTVHKIKYDCCPGTYGDVTYSLTLKRKSLP